VDVPAIRTERLALVSFSPPLLRSLLDGRRAEAAAFLGAAPPPGWPHERLSAFLRLRLDQLGRDPAVEQWLGRFLVLREEPRAVIGHAGFHGPPGTNALRAPDAVEVGYALFPDFRGRGYATEAVIALIAWARETQGIGRFIASVGPDNAPSLALVRRLGFERVGDHWDAEDGLELEFELRVPACP
jgi:[ribosomal protein S5]-alanine N-acetyltransferase